MLTLANPRYGALPPMQVDVEDIPVEPGPYCMSFGYDPTALAGSLEAVGILHPPCLVRNSRGGFDVVSGYRRIVAARSLGWEKIFCRDLSDIEMAPLDLLLLAMHENLATRPFNEVEKAMLLKRLSSHVSRKKLIEKFMPVVRLSPHEPILEAYLRFDELEEPVKTGLAKGSISVLAATHLLECDAPSRLAVYECISTLKLSSGYQRQLIEYLLEISEVENCSVREILSRDAVDQILGKERANNPQKAQSLLLALRAMRNPRLTEAETRFREEVARIGLPPGTRITHPPSFEKPGFSLEVSFRDGRALKQKILQISRLRGLENIQAPWIEHSAE